MPELELYGVEGFDTGACIARVRRQQHPAALLQSVGFKSLGGGTRER